MLSYHSLAAYYYPCIKNQDPQSTISIQLLVRLLRLETHFNHPPTMKEDFSPVLLRSLSQIDETTASHTALLDIEANGNKLSGYAQFHTGNSSTNHSKVNNWQCLPQKSRSYVIPCIIIGILLLVVAPFATIIALIRSLVCFESNNPTTKSG